MADDTPPKKDQTKVNLPPPPPPPPSLPPPPLLPPPPYSLIPEPLPPVLQKLANEEWDIDLKLMQEYADTNARAIGGDQITAGNFNQPEAQFNKEFDHIEAQRKAEIEREALASLVAPLPPENRSIWGAAAAVAERVKHMPELKERIEDLYFRHIGEGREALTYTADYRDADHLEPLVKAFKRGYVDKAPPAHLAISETTKDPAGFMMELLAANPGIGIGEVHVSAAPAHYISTLMDVFKSAGVDTIYLEAPEPLFQKMNNLSSSELRQLARDRRFGDIVISDAKETAQFYHTGYAEDSWSAFAYMMAEAKDRNVRLVNMDKKGPARQLEAEEMIAHRLASCNFIWTENIEADRKTLGEEGKSGKYVVYGGAGHFSNLGMVGKALGVPVIFMEKADGQTAPAFHAGHSSHGPDFYVPGGTKYFDTVKDVEAYDLRDVAQVLKPVSFIPGVSKVADKLYMLSERFRWEADESIGMDSLPQLAPLPPLPPTPPTAPHTPAPRVDKSNGKS